VAITHDELKKKLIEAYPAPTYHALCAVVELHKPDEPDFPDEWESCVECSGNGYVAMYPCQTIKAIEKELE
jgi:hypothetical protein